MIIFRKFTIFQNERALLFKNGLIERELQPGTYRLGRNQIFLRFDMRPLIEMVGNQEVTTSDGATLRLTICATYRIADLSKVFQCVAIDPRSEATALMPIRSAVHLPIQVEVRNWLTSKTLQQALEVRSELKENILEKTKPGLSALGIELLSIDVLDFNIAGTLRSVQADLLKAELEGQAAIVRARNEAATMRSLINTARLTREHPGLLELRILASGQKPRVTFQIASADGSPPLTAGKSAEESS